MSLHHPTCWLDQLTHPEAVSPEAEQTAELVREFVEQTRQILTNHYPANMVLLRGFSERPDWPSTQEAYGLRAVAIAAYPEFRGLAMLVGMRDLETADSLGEEFEALASCWDDFDFFYLHVKSTDSAGEDGDFDRKVALIEQVDAHLPSLLDLNPDVLIVTGDHSTPSKMKYHSWHPVPVLLWSEVCRPMV